MGEGTDEENSDVPDNTSDEQTGDGEDKKAPVTEKEDEQTPADDESDEEQDVTDESEAGSDEELTDENKPADEATVSDEDDEVDKINVNGNVINAVTPTSVTIAVEQYEKDGTPAAAEGGQATDKKLDGNAAAEVTFIDGTSADDSKALGGDRPVQFRLDMKDGWKETGLAVSYTIAKGGTVTEDKTDTLTASGEVYTIPTNVAATTGENATPAGYSGNITIKITAVPVKSTVKLSAAAAQGVSVVLVKADGTPDTEKAITDAAGQDLTYAASTADVTLAVSGLSKKYNTISVTANSGEASNIDAFDTKEVGTDTKTKYYLFKFNPSELDGFTTIADNEVTVTLGEGAEAHGLTLALDSGRTGKWAAAKVTPASSDTEEYITINNDGDAFDMAGITGGLNEDNYAKVSDAADAKKRVLAFKVTPGDALKLKGDKPVKAVLTANADTSDPKTAVQTLDATAVPESAAGAGDGYYKIDLSTLTKTNFTGAMTLTVMVETEVDTTATGVHTISFDGDLKNVTLGMKNDENAFEDLDSSYTAKINDITFGVKPNAGYSLKKGTDYSENGTSNKAVVTVSYDKVYALTTTDDTPANVKATVKVTDEELAVTADSDVAAYLAAQFKFTDGSFTDAAWKGGLPSGTTVDKIATDDMTDDKAEYTKENVVVTVKTELASGKTGFVTIDSDDADYEVSGDGIIKSIGDSYRISEEATLLTLTITSDVEPSVTFDEDNNGRAEVKAGEAEGTYVAEIPVSELAVNNEDAIEDTIVISKGTNTLTVNSTLDGEDDTFGGEIWVNDREFTNGYALTSGMKANVTINAPVGTELVSVAKVVGDDGEEEAVEVGDDKGSVTFPVTMTDDVTVNVALKSVYDAVVKVGGVDAECGDDGVYIIPTGSSNITVSLFKGENTAANILYAKVYDGNEIAVTKATVSTNVATIAKIDEKDTGVLRVDLAATATKKVVASVQIKQEKAADKLIVKDAKNKAVTTVSLMADGPAAEFTVSAESGRLEYAESNIGVEVVAKADDTPAASPVAENDAVKAAYADGKLTITAKPAKVGETAAAVIRLYDKAKRTAAAADQTATDKICLMASAITVNTTNPSVVGQKPVVKEATGTDKTLKIELSTTDKVVEPASNNKVFYKVTIEGTLAGTLTDADKTKYIEKTAWGKNSQIEEIVVDNTPDANGQRVEGSAKDYALKVELVQTTAVTPETAASAVTAATAAAEDTAKTLALGGQVAELKKISTRNPLYETKLKMKPASVTVYTQQTLDKVAKPQTQAQFDKKTGYTVVPYVQFVDTKTGVLLGEASNEADDGNASVEDDDGNTIWEATVDTNGNVKIGYAGWSTAAKYQPKNMGLKVTAEYPEGAYAATAIVKITVANGIENIDFVSGDYRSVYKKSGSPASLKLTPILNWGSKDQAPKKKTLTFAMGDATGKLPGDGGYSLNPEVAARVKVNPKNGAVTVDGKYDVNKGGTFTVVAKAADYEGNEGTTGRVYVDITSQPQELGEVVVVETDDWNSYKVVARDGGTLNAEDFFTYYNNRVLSKNLYVRALKTTAGTKRVYTDDDFVYGVTYASSVKAALGVDTAWGELDFIKPNAKAVKLTITPADGSGTKGKKDMNVTVKGFEKLGLEMYDSNGTHYDARDTEHTYDGAMNEKFELIPVAEMWDDFYKDCWGLGYSNLTVTMKGAKATQKYNGIPTEIVMTAPTATVTIADKTEKSVKTVYTITQDPAADTKAKAPSIKQIGKLTAVDVEDVRNSEKTGVDIVKFQVTNKNVDPVNHARQYVFLTPDYTKTKSVNDWVEWSRAKYYFLNGDNTVIKQIDDNGRFALDLNVDGWEKFEVVPGSYTLIATVGSYSDGKFVPAAKGVNVKINIPGKAAKNNLTVKGKYTLDASAMAPVDLASGNNIVTDYHWTLTNAKDANNNYAMNKIDPKTGKANKFTDYFEVKNVGGSFTLGLKPNLTKGQIEYITGQVKETAKDAKADCEGYVTVSSYMYDEDNHEITKDMKITVSFKDAKYVAKTAEASVYTGAEATVQIFETAKSTDPIALAGAAIVADDKNGGATLVDATSGVTEGTKVKVKLGSAEAGKSYKVTFQVLAADSAYATMAEGNANFIERAKEYGRTVTATIKVSGKDDKTKNKVAVTGKAFKITADDFTTAQANTYTLDIPVRSAIEGTQITAAAVPATVKDKDYEGKDIVSAAYAAQTGKLTLTVKRDKLIEANAAKGGKFKFGKAVDVPVTFTFTDTAVAAETVNLKVTLPNPMTFEKAVEAATKLEDVIGAMNDDLLFAEESDMKADLEERINAAINSAIPKDAQATVSRGITLESIEATDTTPAGYKTKVTVWKGAAKADGDYEHEYTFTKAEAINATVSSLVSAIEGLAESDLAQLGNDYTPAKLLADVKAALAEDDVKIPANLSLSVVGWNLKKATAATAGNLSVAIYVRDRNNVAPIYDEVGEWTEAVAVKSNLTIGALGTLADAKTDVEAAVAEKSDDTGIDYNAVISDALTDTGAKTNIEEALKKAIEDAAKAAIKNPAIKVKGFEKIEKDAGSDNPTTATAPAKAMVDVDFKIPTGSTNGSVSFKLVLEQEGMKDLVVDCTATNKIGVTAKAFTAMNVTGQDISGETPAPLTISSGKVTMAEVDGAKSLKFTAEVTGTQLTAKDKEVTFGLVTQADTTDLEGDNPTLDDIPAATAPAGVTLTTNADGSVTINVAANATWGGDDNDTITLYLRAQKKLKKLYTSDADNAAIGVTDRTKVITIELKKKAAAVTP